MFWHFITAIGLSVLTCCIGKTIGLQFGLIDHPDGIRKLHRAATPLVGGVALMTGLTPYFLGLSNFDLRLQFFGAVCLFLLGALDDRRSISPILRFGIMLGVVLLMVRAIPEPESIRFVIAALDTELVVRAIPWSVFALAITFALVGFIVSVNMADGINGLAPGMLLLWSGLFLAIASPASQLAASLVFSVLAVIWLFNLSGRLFMGDSGIYSAAGLIAVLILGQATADPASLPLDTIAVWVLVPVLDCLRLIVTRSMAGRSPLMGDRTHLHHKLLQVLPANQACALYLLGVGLPAVLALIWPGYNAAWLALAGLGFVLMVNVAKIAPVINRYATYVRPPRQPQMHGAPQRETAIIVNLPQPTSVSRQLHHTVAELRPHAQARENDGEWARASAKTADLDQDMVIGVQYGTAFVYSGISFGASDDRAEILNGYRETLEQSGQAGDRVDTRHFVQTENVLSEAMATEARVAGERVAAQ